MRKLVLSLFTLLYLCCQNRVEKLDPQFTTPESTIRYYWAQLAKRDYKKALSCFENFSEQYYNEKEIFPIPESVDSLEVDSIIYVKYKGKKAEIKYKITYFSKYHSVKKFFYSGDILVLTKTGWKIRDVFIPK